MKKLALLFAPCFFILGCFDGGIISNFDLSPVPTSNVNFQIAVCHMNEDSSFTYLEIYASELQTHLAHGDYKLDIDYDGYTAIGACAGSQDDCNDSVFIIHPNVIEVCGDGIDNNCDGKIDEGCQPCDMPELKAPEDQAIMDNGCKNRKDPIEWRFEWDACQEAVNYNLYVEMASAQKPFIDTIIGQAEFRYVLKGFYVIDQNILNWEWRVRAYANHIWTPWSASRTFSLEPLDTDCP